MHRATFLRASAPCSRRLPVLLAVAFIACPAAVGWPSLPSAAAAETGRAIVDGPRTSHPGIRIYMSDASRRIRQKLGARTSVQFDKTPLADVAAWIERKHNMRAVLSPKLAEGGIEPSTPVSGRYRNMELRAALRHLLDPLALTYTVRDEVLYLTSKDEAEQALVTLVYDVRDLLRRPGGVRQLRRRAQRQAPNSSFSWWRSSTLPFLLMSDGRTRGSGQNWDAWNDLIEVITATVEADTWEDAGGNGTIKELQARSCLVVSQTEAAHEQIAALLETLQSLPVTTEAVAGDTAGIAFPPPSETELAIHRALQQQTKLEFPGVPLSQVRDFIGEAHGIQIVLDPKLETEGAVNSSTLVTAEYSNMKLRSALNLLLEPLDLTYMIRDEVLFITSKEAAGDELLMKIYPVGDLLVSHPDGPADFDDLIDVITETIEPDTWDDAGGSGTIKEFPNRLCLIASQTQEVHEQIESLLATLRALPAR